MRCDHGYQCFTCPHPDCIEGDDDQTEDAVDGATVPPAPPAPTTPDDERKAKQREYARRYRSKNREVVNARSIAWQMAHREQVYERNRLWREKNRAFVNAKAREYYHRKKLEKNGGTQS